MGRLWLLAAATFPLFSVEFLRLNDERVLRVSFAIPMVLLALILAVGLAMAMVERGTLPAPLISRPLGPALYGAMFLLFIWQLVSLMRSVDFKWGLRETVKLALGLVAFWIVLAFFPRDRKFLGRFWGVVLGGSAVLMAFL